MYIYGPNGVAQWHRKSGTYIIFYCIFVYCIFWRALEWKLLVYFMAILNISGLLVNFMAVK
jgi:hypothetical protein